MNAATPEADPTPDAQTRRLSLVLLAACAVGFVLYLWQTLFLYWPYLNDDAYITFRYSRFLAMGRGPYFNIGEHVEGYTNFLTMVTVAGWIKLFGAEGAPVFAKVLGWIAGAAWIPLAGYAARQLFPKDASMRAAPAVAMTMVLAGLHCNYALNAVSGLETTTYGLLVTSGVVLGLASIERQRWRGAGILLALAYLARPEGAFVFTYWWFAQAVAFYLVLRKKSDSVENKPRVIFKGLPVFHVTDGVVFTLVFALHMIFRYVAYEGEFVPNTYHSKIGGYLGQTPAEYVYRGAIEPFAGIFGVTWILALAGLAMVRARLAPLIPIVAAAVGGAAFPLISATDWMPGQRLTVPYMPLLSALFATGMAGLCLKIPRGKVVAWASVPVVALGLLWWQTPTRTFNEAWVKLRAAGHVNAHLSIARWLEEEFDEGDTVAVMDIGVIGFYNPDLQILDISGLTDRFIAQSEGEFLQKTYDPEYVLGQEPEVIILSVSLEASGYEPPPADSRWAFWTPTERTIYRAPGFAQAYRGEPKEVIHSFCQTEAAAGWAARLGARFLRWEAYPATQRHRLQAVFVRQPEL